MADPAKLSREGLEKIRDVSVVTYFSTYIRLMMRELGIADDDKEAINAMIVKMVEPMNTATEAIWRALMEDDTGMRDALHRFEGQLGKL